MAILMQANGTQTRDGEIVPENGQRFTDAEMKNILNCQRFTALRIGKNNLLFINTNGMRKGLQVNRQASEIAADALYSQSDYVAGNAFLVRFDLAPFKRR